MSNSYFQFKQFRIEQEKNAMKITTDACVFGALCDFSNCNQILDIGAGTGLLSLMLAQRFTHSQITSVEIDIEAFRELSTNISHSPWQERIFPICADITAFAKDPLLKYSFDGIISNPPFFKADLQSNKETKNRVRHEEHSLSMSELLDSVEKLLSPEGIFYCLYPTKRLEEFKEELNSKGLTIESLLFLSNNKLSPPHLFISRIRRVAIKVENYTESAFYIRDTNEYSQEMKELMGDFYL